MTAFIFWAALYIIYSMCWAKVFRKLWPNVYYYSFPRLKWTAVVITIAPLFLLFSIVAYLIEGVGVGLMLFEIGLWVAAVIIHIIRSNRLERELKKLDADQLSKFLHSGEGLSDFYRGERVIR